MSYPIYEFQSCKLSWMFFSESILSVIIQIMGCKMVIDVIKNNPFEYFRNWRQYRNWAIILEYSSTCHSRSLGWTATCFGRPLLRCTNYFAMLKYLHPTATCLTRPADSRMLDFIPAKAVNCHGSFQIFGDYCDTFWSKVQHMCVFTCTHYTVDKCCWFFSHIFSIVRFISHCRPIQHCNLPLCL